LKIKLPAAPVTRTLTGSVATIMIWSEILESKKWRFHSGRTKTWLCIYKWKKKV